MNPLKHTLICDGPTDVNLIPIINWTLTQVAGVDLVEGIRAEFWRLPCAPDSLQGRICKAIDLFPCDVLFIHRDAEKESLEMREAEIRAAVANASASGSKLPAVAIVPIRMTEAWLLFNESAIRKAAGNPNGQIALNLPPLNKLESRPDPKKDLQRVLKNASELQGRRLKKFNLKQAFWRISDYLDDFTPLRQLSAYSAFENAVRRMKANNWNDGFYGLSDNQP
ncbi:MAG TPA: hypothetical protein VGN23_15635 [Verrucomicrobiae bacterium]|jgi:hypothetical protein